MMVRLVRALLVMMRRMAVGWGLLNLARLNIQMRLGVIARVTGAARPDAGLQSANQQQRDQKLTAKTIQSS